MKMVVKSSGLGASQMDRHISGIKFIIFCLNIILWVSFEINREKISHFLFDYSYYYDDFLIKDLRKRSVRSVRLDAPGDVV